MRTCALPTTFPSGVTTSPGAGTWKQGPASGARVTPPSATVTSAPRSARPLAMPLLILRYAALSPPTARAGATVDPD